MYLFPLKICKCINAGRTLDRKLVILIFGVISPLTNIHPGGGGAHKPCAAAISCKHSEHRRCKMCDFYRKVWVYQQSESRDSRIHGVPALFYALYRQLRPMRRNASTSPGMPTDCAATAGTLAITCPLSSTRTKPMVSPASTGASTCWGSSTSSDSCFS